MSSISTVRVGTYFYDDNGRQLGSATELLPIPLFKGMKVTMDSHKETFQVVDWHYHHGHGEEESGLRIILSTSKQEGSWGHRA